MHRVTADWSSKPGSVLKMSWFI